MRVALLVVLAGCATAIPPGWSSGDPWTFPLVEPLAKEPLIVPVLVDGQGPFLFAVEPSNATQVDDHVVGDLPVRYLQVGTLRIHDPTFQRPPHAIVVRGRQLAGVLGAGVFLETLAFGFDRDRGLGWLSRPQRAPALAHARSVDGFRSGHGFVWVTGSVDGAERDFLVDLGRVANVLKKATEARHVVVGGVERFDVAFGAGDPAAPTRRSQTDPDAVLGLDFFWSYIVAVDFDARRIAVAPRMPASTSERIARWSLGCKRLGCAELLPHTTSLEVIPERAPMQLIVRATSPTGAELPSLEVNLDPGARRFAVTLDSTYADASFELVDASPFPRTCEGAKECIVPFDAATQR